MTLDPLLSALLLSAGYNAALVAIGAALIGAAAGAAGAFLFLRNRALVSDAVAHATLPGVGLAFIAMVALGGDGRSLIGLLVGSALSAALGLWLIQRMTAKTRLDEDAAIGAILSVFFGIGVVLLTVIQSMSAGRQAGLEGFLLGSTAGMLLEDAVVIALGGAAVAALVVAFRRPMTMVAFDAAHAASLGVDVRRVDLMMMALAMAVTVIGLKLVGLVLIVALLIIPAATARFWTDRTAPMIGVASAVGAVAGYGGVAISASAPALPTGPIIVLVAAALFFGSMLVSPSRGVLATVLRHRRFQTRVHRRQGLLALARAEPIFDRLTLAVLQRDGLIRADGVATEAGRAQAAKAVLDEARWDAARRMAGHDDAAAGYDGLTEIEARLTPDEIAEIDRQLGAPALVPGEGAA